MAAPLLLRARAPSGGAPVLLENLTTASTFSDLDCAIRTAFGITEDKEIVILAGFPPRPLTLEEDAELGNAVPSNEILTVREGTVGGATVLAGTGAMGARGRKKAAAGAAAGKRKGGPSAPVLANAPRAFGSNVHTLHGPRGGASRGGGGGGRRAPKRPRGAPAVRSEEDVGELLLAAVARGGGGGRIRQGLRAVFRVAVDKQYDQAKAEARLSSVLGRKYVIEESSEARRLDGQAARIKVTYHRGHGHRSNYEDDVELCSKLQLLGVIGSVLSDEDAREMLKPPNMAGCSPRVFWSLVKHYDGDIEGGLRQLFPDQDWGWLHERMRKLSEKAAENKRQEEERRREREEAARASREEREARIAARRAAKEPPAPAPGEALTPASAVTGGDAEVVVVDEEEGGDEDAEVDTDLPESVSYAWVRVLMRPRVGLGTSRALAGADVGELVGVLRGERLPKGHTEAPQEEEVRQWVRDCQAQELDDIMVDVVSGDPDVLEVMERVHVATPMDMTIWAKTPGALVDTVRAELGEEAFEEFEDRVTPEAVGEWAAKAQDYVHKLPWLEMWVSE